MLRWYCHSSTGYIICEDTVCFVLDKMFYICIAQSVRILLYHWIRYVRYAPPLLYFPTYNLRHNSHVSLRLTSISAYSSVVQYICILRNRRGTRRLMLKLLLSALRSPFWSYNSSWHVDSSPWYSGSVRRRRRAKDEILRWHWVVQAIYTEMIL